MTPDSLRVDRQSVVPAIRSCSVRGDWSARVRDDDGVFPESYTVDFGDESTLGATGWHHLVMVLDRDNNQLHAYLDGQLVDSATTNNLSGLDNDSDEARAGGDLDLLRGFVDEVRFLKSPVSADWVAVDYANGQGTLMIIGDPESTLE